MCEAFQSDSNGINDRLAAVYVCWVQQCLQHYDSQRVLLTCYIRSCKHSTRSKFDNAVKYNHWPFDGGLKWLVVGIIQENIILIVMFSWEYCAILCYRLLTPAAPSSKWCRVLSICGDEMYSVRQGQRTDCPHKESQHYTWLKSAHHHSFSLLFERDEFIK